MTDAVIVADDVAVEEGGDRVHEQGDDEEGVLVTVAALGGSPRDRSCHWCFFNIVGKIFPDRFCLKILFIW